DVIYAQPRAPQHEEVAGETRPVNLAPVLPQPRLLLVDPGGIRRRGRDAFTGELGGDPLTHLRFLPRIDQRVQLALAEQVDESGREREILELDPPPGLAPGEIAYRRDGIAADADIGAKPWSPGAVHHAAAGEEQVE